MGSKTKLVINAHINELKKEIWQGPLKSPLQLIFNVKFPRKRESLKGVHGQTKKSVHQAPDLEMMEDPWRIFRIMAEFVDGFEELKNVGPAVSIFGSSLHSAYEAFLGLSGQRRKQPELLVQGRLCGDHHRRRLPASWKRVIKGLPRQAANPSGLNIDLPFEQKPNPNYINHLINFHYFFCRKVCFVKYAKAFAQIFPGSAMGRLDELSESITLIQTQRDGPISGHPLWQRHRRKGLNVYDNGACGRLYRPQRFKYHPNSRYPRRSR